MMQFYHLLMLQLFLIKKDQLLGLKIYPDYKMNRTEPPIDLIPQFELIREAAKAFGLASIEMEGYEADDIIATYVELALERRPRTTIISSVRT